MTSTTYNQDSEPTQVNLGSSDSDSFTYDPNTFRDTKYQFTVNSQSVVGQLTWNSIGTLASLSITDPFFGAGNQSCTYSHDDITRIAGVNCGSPWTQTFGYDSFGNLTKSGSMSFAPTYSYLTNRMTQIGSSTPTYDSNGNVTNDFLHMYTWDAVGRPVTIDTVTATYDALGRMVEQNKSGVFTEIAYTPSGQKLAIMSGQTLQKAFVLLPGGATAVYNSSGLAYYRHSDWVGSSRFASTPTRTMYSDTAYGPFGEPYAQTGTTDVSFTGMNQDTVPNLYDFAAREYGTQGRWPSPDPAGSSSASPRDPQTWNRYAYVTNNPMSYVDEVGMVRTPPGLVPGADGWSGDFGACAWDDGSNDDPDDPNTGTYDSCTAAGGTFISQLGDSDYNPDSNEDVSNLVSDIQDSYVDNVTDSDSAASDVSQCLSGYQSSTLGKVISFGSVLSFAGNFVGTAKEWIGTLAIKGGYFKIAEVAGQSVTAAGETTGVTTVAKPLIGQAGTLGVFGATTADLAMRAGCSIGNDPRAMTAYTLNPF